MQTTSAGPDDAIRRAADQIEAAVGRGRFRRRRALEVSGRGESLVPVAVERARHGDADALRFLYLRYADNVYGYVCSIVADEHEAEDVTQHTFAKLLTSLDRYRSGSVPFSGWILRVARNTAIDHLRARRPVPLAEVRDVDEPDAADAARERFADLRLALDALPAEQRDVLMLRFLLGLSPGEVAERMGRSVDAVHGLQHRGRRRLRTAMPAAAA